MENAWQKDSYKSRSTEAESESESESVALDLDLDSNEWSGLQQAESRHAASFSQFNPQVDDGWNENPPPPLEPLEFNIVPSAATVIQDTRSQTIQPGNMALADKINLNDNFALEENIASPIVEISKSKETNQVKTPRLLDTSKRKESLTLTERSLSSEIPTAVSFDSKASPIHSPFTKGRMSTSSTDPRLSRSQSKSQTLSQIQKVFTDSQKIAYVGLCYLSMHSFRKKRLASSKKALGSFDKWSERFMEKLYVYLDLLPEERKMIVNLAEHGLLPEDLSGQILIDWKKAEREFEVQKDNPSTGDSEPNQVPAMDIRYTILSHLFLLSICDGVYDSRSRSMLKTVCNDLQVPSLELKRLENCIANELRVYEEPEETIVKHDDAILGERNTKEGKGRWLYTGLGVIAGGALIGVTAGLAAPFIGAGIGAALTSFGVAQGAVVGGFMATTGGVALITGGGVLTGGGFTGNAMLNRTRGMEEFEFLPLDEALKRIQEARTKRRIERLKSVNNESLAKELQLQLELNSHLHSNSSLKGAPISSKGSVKKDSAPVEADLLWEMKEEPVTAGSETHPNLKSATEEGKDEQLIENWAGTGGCNDEDADNASLQSSTDPNDLSTEETPKQTNVLITISGWVAYDQNDHSLPFSTIERGLNGDQHTLIWETRTLQELGSTMSIIAGEIAQFIFQQGLQATVLPVLMAGLTGPLWLMKLNYLVDNPWGNALSKAEKAGRMLADTLIGQVQSNRPVSLVGFSIGARLIYFCLMELAAQEAFGIIENIFILGTPCVSFKADWEKISSVVSGKIHNCYNPNDTQLGILYRASMTSYKDVPGLSAIEGIEGIDNYDVSDIIEAHLEYASKMPLVLKRLGFEVNSEEIIDQDSEEAAWKAEVEAERQKEKEKKEKERQIQLDKLSQDKKAGEEKRRILAEAEFEKKRLEKEARLAEKKRVEMEAEFKRAAIARTGPAPVTSNPIVKAMTMEQIAAEELSEMEAMESMMMQYWEPREISSTLPPLVISTKKDETPVPTAENVDEGSKPTEVGGEFDSASDLSDF